MSKYSWALATILCVYLLIFAIYSFASGDWVWGSIATFGLGEWVVILCLWWKEDND